MQQMSVSDASLARRARDCKNRSAANVLLRKALLPSPAVSTCHEAEAISWEAGAAVAGAGTASPFTCHFGRDAV